jgi:predicted nucleotidyltransferase
MVYTIEQLKQKITPIAVKYSIPAVYLFGSYARGDATDGSDVDILIDRTGSSIRTAFQMGGLYEDLRGAIEKAVDLVTTGTLEQENTRRRTPWFVENLNKDKVIIYEKH